MILPKNIKNGALSNDISLKIECTRLLEKYDSPESVGLLMKLLKDDDFTVFNTAKLSLIKLGNDFVIEECVHLLGSEDVKLRNSAIEILHYLGDKSIDQVAQLLTHKKVDIRKFAVDVLERIGSINAETPLIQALHDKNINVAAEAAIGLGKIKSKKAIPFLLDTLKKDTWLKCCGINALGEIGSPDALPPLLAIPTTEENTILYSVVNALRKIKHHDAIPYLLELEKLQNTILMPYVIDALANILKESSKEIKDKFSDQFAVFQYAPCLDEYDEEALSSLIYLIGICQEKRVLNKLISMYTQKNERFLKPIEDAVTAIGITDFQAFFNLFENEQEPESIKIAILNFLKKYKTNFLNDYLISVFEGESFEFKLTLLDYVSTNVKEKEIKFLHDCLENENEEIVSKAIEILVTVNKNESIPFLEELLQSDDDTIQEKAAIALSNFKGVEQMELIDKWLLSDNLSDVKNGINLLPEKPLVKYASVLMDLFQKHNELKGMIVQKANYFDPENRTKIVRMALKQPNSKTRLEAIKVIPNLENKDQAIIIKEVLRSDSDDWNKYQGIKMAQLLNKKEVLPSIVQLCDDNSDILIAGMIDFITAIKAVDHWGIIEKYQDSESPIIKDAAFQALTQIKVAL